MILLNFSHPLTPEQIAQVETLTAQKVEQVISLSVQFDNDQPYNKQLDELMTHIHLEPAAYQTQPILVNPPSLNYITALLLAELHGRMGYFPPVVRLRPAAGSLPPRYEVAEVLNLQARRDAARLERFNGSSRTAE